MEFIDYYKILGIDKSATEADIKKAYRKMARKYHPDLNPHDKEAEQKFKEINEANEVLSHPENRKKYDQYGKDWQHAEAFEQAKRQESSRQSRQQDFTGGSYSGGDFSDFFESMFGGAASSARRERGNIQFKGQDLNAELHLTLKDVYDTQQQVLVVNGKKIRLTIPAGVENGQVIKIPGKGGEGMNGGPNGDLFITFTITNTTSFKRHGHNLHTTKEIDLYTAILGGQIEIDTFNGKVKLQVAPGTQNDTKIRLKGKGFPIYKKENQYGDLIITYNIQIPKNLTANQKKLFEQLKNLS